MDINSINGVVRAVLPAILAYAAAKGWISSSSVGDITAAVAAIIAALWSVASNRPTTTTTTTSTPPKPPATKP